LEADGWETYAEVPYFGKRADIVATKAGLVIVVETKTSYTLSLLEQALFWKRHVHAVYVSAPQNERLIYQKIRRYFGIGIVIAGDLWDPSDSVLREGVLNRHASRSVQVLRSLLVEERRDQRAGMAGGGYYTAFSGTCDSLRRVLKSLQGEASWADILARMQHHYGSDATARSALTRWIRQGCVAGVEIVEGRPLKVRLKEPQ
jgi:hypothetical protein